MSDPSKHWVFADNAVAGRSTSRPGRHHSAVNPSTAWNGPDETIEAAAVADILAKAAAIGDACTKLTERAYPYVGDPDPCTMAERLLSVRRSRPKSFPPAWFGEAAWDVVLDAYISQKQRRMLTVSGACHISGVPHTTALRWIAQLVEAGWLIRVDHAHDRRSVLVELAEGRSETIEAWLRWAWARLNGV